MRLQQRSRGRDGLWLVRRVLLVAGGFLALVLAAGIVYLAGLPGVGDAPQRTSRIMLAHGESAAVLSAPARLVDAVVSVEDEHFYDDVVVNVLTGIGRGALATLRTSQDPGGSTIEQQLAKQLYGDGHGVASTLREISLGVKLAVHHSKPQILAMYLNAVYYGHGFWGVRQASEGYFGTSPAELTWAEASMLAGLLQAPSAYDPVAHYAIARQRQHHVLSQLVVNHYLTAAEAQAVFSAGVHMA